MVLRMQGMKIEPAFALALGLNGDPHEAVSDLFGISDPELAEVIYRTPEL